MSNTEVQFMSNKYNTLILGASYGSLLGCKLALAGHPVTLVCTAPTAKLINQRGVEPAVVYSKSIDTQITAATPSEIDVDKYDLVVLGMQEPQYGNAEVRALMAKIAEANVSPS